MRHLWFALRLVIGFVAAVIWLRGGIAEACSNCGCCRIDPIGLAEGAAAGEVIISEIMYNPGGTDVQTTAPTFNKEWVELYNTGSTTIDISGWQLGDSQDNNFASAFPAGTL